MITLGKTILDYKILAKFGEGGMGVVYNAEDTKLKCLVALRFLPPALTRDEDAKLRFISKAKTQRCSISDNFMNAIRSHSNTAELLCAYDTLF